MGRGLCWEGPGPQVAEGGPGGRAVPGSPESSWEGAQVSEQDSLPQAGAPAGRAPARSPAEPAGLSGCWPPWQGAQRGEPRRGFVLARGLGPVVVVCAGSGPQPRVGNGVNSCSGGRVLQPTPLGFSTVQGGSPRSNSKLPVGFNVGIQAVNTKFKRRCGEGSASRGAGTLHWSRRQVRSWTD